MAAEVCLEVTYVGQKISKVCWKPQPPGAIASSEIFASGSWDDESNKVCVWSYKSPGVVEDGEMSPDIVEPELLCEVETPADVTGLKFLDEMRVAASFTNGCVTLFNFHNKMLSIAQRWPGLHGYHGSQPAACTSLAVVSGGEVLVTCGEDGRINVLQLLTPQPIRTLDNADNGALTALVCTLQSELLTTSSSGQLKLWDLRNHDNQPSRILTVSDDCLPMHCLDRHPQQPHLVAVGRADGSVCFWDLRSDRRALEVIQAHSSDVWDVKFHSSYPNNLFTCSQDGSLWHWNASTNLPPHPSTHLNPPQPPSTNHSFTSSATHPHAASKQQHKQQQQQQSASGAAGGPWLSGAVAQGKVEFVNYLSENRLPVNSLDIESRHLVCGADGEALYVVPNLALQ